MRKNHGQTHVWSQGMEVKVFHPVKWSIVALQIAALVAATLGISVSAYGADADNPAPAKPKNTQPPDEHLLGDWGGVRTTLADKGVDLKLNYIGQFAADISGGKRTGVDYAQQLEFVSDLDWSKIAGISGLTTHADFINRAGRNLSKDYVGDNIAQAQSIYGGGGNVVVHLAELYNDLKLASGRIDIAAGRMSVGEDYATSPLYCKFMSTMVCGYPNSLAAKQGFSVFPNSTWGGRLRVNPVDHLYIQAGVYEVRPWAGGRSGFNWGTSGTTGTYFPVEIGYEPSFGPNQLEGHYKIGYARDTSNYPDLLKDAAGRAFVETAAQPLVHSGRSSTYVLVDQMLMRNGDGPGNGLILLGGYVHSDPPTSQYSNFAFVGLTDRGIISSRPGDSFSLMAAKQRVSHDLTLAQMIQSKEGIPLSHDAIGVQTDENVVEMNYEIAVGKGFSVMPDIQYVIHPGAAHTYPNALMVGLQIKASL